MVLLLLLLLLLCDILCGGKGSCCFVDCDCFACNISCKEVDIRFPLWCGGWAYPEEEGIVSVSSTTGCLSITFGTAFLVIPFLDEHDEEEGKKASSWLEITLVLAFCSIIGCAENPTVDKGFCGRPLSFQPLIAHFALYCTSKYNNLDR